MSFIFLVVLFAEPIGTAGAAKLHNYLRVWRGEFEIENVRMCPWFASYCVEENSLVANIQQTFPSGTYISFNFFKSLSTSLVKKFKQ